MVEALAARDFFFTFALVVHNNLARAVAVDGSARQREEYLPDILSGARIGAFLLTEPGVGAIAAFLVEAGAPGVTLEDRLMLPAVRALGVGSFRFDRCRLDGNAEFLPPGRGFKMAMEGIDLARVMVAAMC